MSKNSSKSANAIVIMQKSYVGVVRLYRLLAAVLCAWPSILRTYSCWFIKLYCCCCLRCCCHCVCVNVSVLRLCLQIELIRPIRPICYSTAKPSSSTVGRSTKFQPTHWHLPVCHHPRLSSLILILLLWGLA